MKGFRQQFRALTGCLFLICALIITASAAYQPYCAGNCGHQAAIGTTHYDTLAEAVSAAKEGTTVTLLKDTQLTMPLRIRTPLTLDLGGNTLSAALTSPRQAAVRVLADAVVRNGEISVSMGSALRASDCKLTIEKDAKLQSTGDEPVLSITAFKDQATQVELSGAIYSEENGPAIDAWASEGSCELYILEDAQVNAEKGTAIVFDSTGKLEISGGTAQSSEDTIHMVLARDRDTQIAISDGKLFSQKGQVITFVTDTHVKLPKDFVTGGTFYPVPTDYIPNSSQLTENADGTVTVNGGSAAHQHTGGYATCVSKAICTVCGQAYGNYGSHSLVSRAATAPTCDQVGMQAHSACQHCGSTYANGTSVTSASLTIAALGHDWETRELIPATCEAEGKKAHRICKTCQAIQVSGKDATEEELVISSGTHQLEAVTETQATCKAAGVRAHEKCSVCKGLFANGKPVTLADLTSATSTHVLTDWQQDGTYHWKACVDCQEVFRQSVHKDKQLDGVCDECGLALSASEASGSQEGAFSSVYLIPVMAAVIIGIVGIFTKLKKKPQ